MIILTTDMDSVPWIKHGFFTRRGGISGGIYGQLNCGLGSNDHPDHVFANRARVAETLEIKPENLVTVHQVHSAKVVTVSESFAGKSVPEADAMVTETPGIGLAVLTADCAPVLLTCRRKKIIGAAHAGWRGAFDGVLQATVQKMQDLGAEDIAAAIGPCIGPKSYEVDRIFYDRFMQQSNANGAFFADSSKKGHHIFDLPGYVASVLKKSGVADVFDTARDTLAEPEVFFSYRRTTLNKEPDYGRQMSVITLV
jgi:YfiH family protein